LRIGIVLDSNEGALPKISAPVKAYIGSVLGSGEQWQSWIHIQDLVRIFMFVLELKLDGVYNAVAPNPVQQIDFVKSVASVLKRPLILPKTPKFFTRFFAR
jgi:NAD dependent epimerase/dehydratase family enzyme